MERKGFGEWVQFEIDDNKAIPMHRRIKNIKDAQPGEAGGVYRMSTATYKWMMNALYNNSFQMNAIADRYVLEQYLHRYNLNSLFDDQVD